MDPPVVCRGLRKKGIYVISKCFPRDFFLTIQRCLGCAQHCAAVPAVCVQNIFITLNKQKQYSLMVTPRSSFPLAPDNHEFTVPIYLPVLHISYDRNHMICGFFLSVFFHLVQCVQSLSMLQYRSVCHPFFNLLSVLFQLY